MKKKRITKQIETGYVDLKTGEVLKSESLKEWSVPREEPDYIKLYLNAVLEFRDVSCSNTPTLMALMKYMSFADDENGGQMIILNKYVKNRIADELGIKQDTLRKNIEKLCFGRILRKIETNTYQVNPYLIGKGDWNSIKNLRASFDWENGFIVAETEHETNTAKNKEIEKGA